MKTYRQHKCTANHRSYLTFAKCAFRSWATWVKGEGPYALLRSAADLDAALVDVERCVAALATATSTLEARRLACLEASPITDQERADLIAEETR